MTYTNHQTCERCWMAEHFHQYEDGSTSFRPPTLIHYDSPREMTESVGPCCTCGEPTCVGIFVRGASDDYHFPMCQGH